MKNSTAILLVSISCIAIAQDIYINKQQLQETQEQIKNDVKKALNIESEISDQIAKIKISKDDIDVANKHIQKARSQLKNYEPLNIKLPTGETYHVFSESLINDNQKLLSQYKNPLDINKTITDYNLLVKNAKVQVAGNQLLIFVSSKMPKKTLVNLMNQASSLGAVFVIRGLMNNSYTKTYKYFFSLRGNNNISIVINPPLFKAFDVNVVPTFALYKSDQNLMTQACKTTPIFTKVSGEVTVKYALEQLKGSKHADLSQIAGSKLDILENQNFYKGK